MNSFEVCGIKKGISREIRLNRELIEQLSEVTEEIIANAQKSWEGLQKELREASPEDIPWMDEY